jgi:glycosyltransferase involved in cell wall biosynthesis
MPPRVSVLLPAHDAAATLAACLRSLCRQRFTDWECVLVDDGSTDETGAIAAGAARADARIRILSLPHRGLVAALNEGLAACRGPLVARMDADDVMHRDRFAAQADALAAQPALAGVGCHVRLFPRQGLRAGRREYEQWLNSLLTPADVRRDLFVECPIAHPTLMMRREALAALQYCDGPWAEDYDLVLRAAEAGHALGVVPRRLVLWRDGPGRLSRVDPRYDLARFTACKAHYLARGFLASAAEYVLWGYGDTGKALRTALAAHGKSASHIVEIAAGRIGQRIHGAPVVPIDALPSLRGRMIVVSVARQGPRREIRAALAAMGFEERRDYVCAA